MNDYNVVSLNQLVLTLGGSQFDAGISDFGITLNSLVAHYLCGALSIDPESDPDRYRSVWDATSYMLLQGVHNVVSDESEVGVEVIAARMNCAWSRFRADRDHAAALRVVTSDVLDESLGKFVTLAREVIVKSTYEALPFDFVDVDSKDYSEDDYDDDNT